MNGIEKITRRIEEATQAEIDNILEKASDEAAQIAENYRTQIRREKADMAARNERAAAERKERLISAAQMEARKTALAARQDMVGRAYALALEKLRSLGDAEYTEVAANLMVQAAPDGRGEAIFSEADRARVGEAAVAKANALLGERGARETLTLSQETRPIQGGFVLKTGNVEVNCTFDTLVRLQETETAGEVAKKLFD